MSNGTSSSRARASNSATSQRTPIAGSNPFVPTSNATVRCGWRSGLTPADPSGLLPSSVVVGVSKLVETVAYTEASGAARHTRPNAGLTACRVRSPESSGLVAVTSRSFTSNRTASARTPADASRRGASASSARTNGPRLVTSSRWFLRSAPRSTAPAGQVAVVVAASMQFSDSSRSSCCHCTSAPPTNRVARAPSIASSLTRREAPPLDRSTSTVAKVSGFASVRTLPYITASILTPAPSPRASETERSPCRTIFPACLRTESASASRGFASSCARVSAPGLSAFDTSERRAATTTRVEAPGETSSRAEPRVARWSE